MAAHDHVGPSVAVPIRKPPPIPSNRFPPKMIATPMAKAIFTFTWKRKSDRSFDRRRRKLGRIVDCSRWHVSVLLPSRGNFFWLPGHHEPFPRRAVRQESSLLFLAPIRRDVLMVGKCLAGLSAAVVIFTSSEALQILLFAGRFDTNVLNNYSYHGDAFAHVAAYLGITVLACIGYGSLFLAPVCCCGHVLWEATNRSCRRCCRSSASSTI